MLIEGCMSHAAKGRALVSGLGRRSAPFASRGFKFAKVLASPARECSQALLDLLYPPVCGACSSPLQHGRDPVHRVFCSDCAESLVPVGSDCCPRCAAPGALSHVQGESREICDDCRRLAPVFESTAAAWCYGGPLLEALHRLKYGGELHLARPLARLHLFGLQPLPPVDLIVPVPSHPSRVRRRGFDHVACMADEAGRLLGLPVRHGLLRKTKVTPPQARLGLRARLEGPKGSVAADRKAPRKLEDMRVLLVDDVMTTGATANTCASALLAAGADAVSVTVLARAG